MLPWEAGARVAERFRHDRIFLAGDAAHVMPPSGAFGLNAAVQDAHALSWRLASVLRDAGSEALLEAYEAERREVAQVIVQHSVREFLGGAERHAPPDSDQSGPGDREPSTDDVEDLKREQLALVLGPANSYGTFLAEVHATDPFGLPDGRPGMRVPHAWIEADGRRVSTIDVVAHQWTLLTGRINADRWTEALREALPLFVSPVLTQIVPDEVAARVGITFGGAMLVRPDGVVAWRSVAHDGASGTTLSAVAGRLFSPRVAAAKR